MFDYFGMVIVTSPSLQWKKFAALAHGHTTVRLLPGRYHLTEIRLGSGARLVGSGPRTIIAAPRGSYWALLVASGQKIRVSDLAMRYQSSPLARARARGRGGEGVLARSSALCNLTLRTRR